MVEDMTVPVFVGVFAALLVGGIGGVWWSTRLTDDCLDRRGLSSADLNRLPGGSGVVPGWVSCLFLLSAAMIGGALLMIPGAAVVMFFS